MPKSERVVWVGFCDGRPYLGADDGYEVRCARVFLTKREALKCFEDVRRARLVIERPVSEKRTGHD